MTDQELAEFEYITRLRKLRLDNPPQNTVQAWFYQSKAHLDFNDLTGERRVLVQACHDAYEQYLKELQMDELLDS